jgi:hypothetical protein
MTKLRFGRLRAIAGLLVLVQLSTSPATAAPGRPGAEHPPAPCSAGPSGAAADAAPWLSPRGASEGTPGYLGLFTSTADLGNSVLFQSGAFIGINTVTPAAGLHTVATAAPGTLFDVYSNSLGALPVVQRAARGTPAAPSAVQANDILGGLAVRGFGATAFSTGRGQVMFKAAENWTDTAQGTYLQITTTPAGQSAWVERVRIDDQQTTITGNLVITGTLNSNYQDVAEWVPSAEPLAAGTVVVVDPAATNGVRRSMHAYDVAVAGAVSAQPGVVLGDEGTGKSLVAQSGRVRVKVDASYAPIRAGDLLVTSPTPGHAMRSQPVEVSGVWLHRPGTMLGKALESLGDGRGEILVLLTLQ